MHHPKVGIVIVSYNASLAVRITLAGLRQAKNNIPYKLILVDNASKDSERNTIKMAFDKHTSQTNLSCEYIQLHKNLGFSGGNNVGIKKFLNDSEISHICLLNSDVIVGDFWIDRLVEKQCEAISAVTNKAYSEQCVPTDYNLDFDDCFDIATESIPATAFNTINTFSQNWYRAWQNNLVQTEVTFFCVLLTRALIEKIGLLDEQFFPGGYEDDDYCARIKANDISIFLARDVFIHHFGSTSFSQLNQEYFNKQASKNRLYLEKKHNLICKRRPERPVISYAQDIVYALKGYGNHDLQWRYNLLYVKTLVQLIQHHQQEYIALCNHLIQCGHLPSASLQSIVNTAGKYGDITEMWNDVLADINKALSLVPVRSSLIHIIEQKLKTVADAVYAKAEANIAIVAFLCDVGVFSAGPSNSKKSPIQKVKWFITKGLPFIWKVKGIVFFGGYPYKEREKDGYFQRVRSIDNLFTDRWRIYVDHGRLPSKDSWYDRPAPKTIVLHMHNHKYMWFMHLIVQLCVLKCRTVYFHSVLRMDDSRFGYFMRWIGIKKVIDIHGVVPEEFRMHNDFYSAGIFDAYEKLAVKKADCMLVVTRAMHHYFQHKYREALQAKVIVLPIFPTIKSSGYNKPYIDGKPIVVYAGGTHKWQQVPKMIDAMAVTKEICFYKFFCPTPAEVLAIMPEDLRNDSRIIVDSKPFEELIGIYETCHYGFILREDIIVNHAACPTKLVEYMAMGIVPIVDCEDMGDFKTLGMQFVKLKDLIAANLPNEYARSRMAQSNYTVYQKLQEMNSNGKRALQNALSNKKQFIANNSSKQLALTIKSVAKPLLPKNTIHGRLARKIWWNLKGAMSLQENRIINNGSQAESSAIEPTLPPCDIILQVDNFVVGGLENVILYQIDVFIEAGLQVGLLILGEAGAAAERAKNKGIPISIITYRTDTYKKLFKTASPKAVIAHYSFNGANICNELNIPFIQVVQNTYMWFTDEQIYQFAKAAKYTTAFIAVSEYAKDYTLACLGVSAENCLVIPNGIDLESFKIAIAKNENMAIRKKHNLSEDDFVFLSVGSINHQKNHISTVRAFHTALKECPTAKLVILGKLYEQHLWAEIQAYINIHHLNERIIYAGESSNPPAYYAMADAFLQSSFFEGGQLSLLEAIASNLPIVVNEIGFAKHFKGCKGIIVVPPPVEIINYKGSITDLTSTLASDLAFAKAIIKTYKERVRPDMPKATIERFDKKHTYQIYIDLVKHVMQFGTIANYTLPKAWPQLLSLPEETVTLTTIS